MLEFTQSTDRKNLVKYVSLCALLAAASLAAAPAAAQEIVTAAQYFNLVADRYAQVADYEGKISIATGKDVMKGDISFKAPSLLRVDFTSPPDQVIAFDGQTLTVYIPGYNAILSQSAADKPGAGSASLATREGLKMLKRNYSVAFESSPAPLPLDGGSPGEEAVRLVLVRTSAAEGFKTLKLYVSPDSKLIRRIEGWTIAGDKLSFDFTGIKTNVGIPDSHFVYDSPASANVYNNFLFKSDN
jgi:outer membrane lipoprotein-sorting protein